MPSTVQQVMSDPEFQKADPAVQQELLKGIDPAFGSLSSDAFSEFVKGGTQKEASKETTIAGTTVTAPEAPHEGVMRSLQETAGKAVPQAAIPALGWAQRHLVEPLEKLGQEGTEAGEKAGKAFTAVALHPEEAYQQFSLGQAFKPSGQESPVLTKTAAEHPIATGVAEAVGGVGGGLAFDPRNYPFLAERGGAEAGRTLLKRAIDSGFALQMGKGVHEGAVNLWNNWGNMAPEERSKAITELGIQSAFTAGAARGAVSKMPAYGGKAEGFKPGAYSEATRAYTPEAKPGLPRVEYGTDVAAAGAPSAALMSPGELPEGAAFERTPAPETERVRAAYREPTPAVKEITPEEAAKSAAGLGIIGAAPKAEAPLGKIDTATVANEVTRQLMPEIAKAVEKAIPAEEAPKTETVKEEAPKVEAPKTEEAPKVEAAAAKEPGLVGSEYKEEAPPHAAVVTPDLREQVGLLSHGNLRDLARAHGLEPDEYGDFKKDRVYNPEKRRYDISPGRTRLADDVVSAMPEDEKALIGGNIRQAASEPGWADRDVSGKAKADRAAGFFPRLRGPEVPPAEAPSVESPKAEVPATETSVKSEKPAVETIDYKTMAKTHNEGTGSTFDKSGNLSGKDAWSVGGYAPTETIPKDNPLSEEDIEKFSEKNKKVLDGPDMAVGSWKDKDGNHVLDVVKLIKDNKEAEEEGKRLNQQGIYHLGRGEYKPTGGTGEYKPAEEEKTEKEKEISKEEDGQYRKAVQLVANTGSASVSAISKGLDVDYVQAIAFIDRMEKEGVVAPAEGAGPRRVATLPEWAQKAKAVGYGASNVGVTKSEYDQAVKGFNEKLMGGLKAGVPFPADELSKIARYHLEAGARSFADWSTQMIKDLGEKARPYLEDLWAGERPARDLKPRTPLNNPQIEEKGKQTWIYNPDSTADPAGKGMSRMSYNDMGKGVARVTGIYGEKPGHGQQLYDTAIQDAVNKGFTRFESDETMTEDARNAWRRLSDKYDVNMAHNKEGDPQYWIDLKPLKEESATPGDTGVKLKSQATAETAKMSDDELKKLGYTQEQIDAGLHLPKVGGGLPKLPTGKDLVKKYGTADDPSHAGFILQDGTPVALALGGIHDEMLGGKATDVPAPRERFIKEQGGIRVRSYGSMGDRQFSLSVPSDGITQEQMDRIKKWTPQMGTGRVYVETPDGDHRVIDYGKASSDLEGAIKDLVSIKKPVTAIPEELGKRLLPEERAGLKTEVSQKKFVDIAKKLPSVQEFVDVAAQASGERKWYQRGSEAVKALSKELPAYFKEGDTSRFLDLVAALSPRQAIAENMTEALRVWKEYVDQDRPEETKQLKKLLNENIGINRGSKVPNALKALGGEEMWPDLSKNRYFKVPSFSKNLQGFLDRVTSDGWIGAFADMDEKAIQHPSGYHALTAITRSAAEELGWEPAEAQAAVWAFVKTLVEKGESEPKEIRALSKDFADIIGEDQDIQEILKDMGVDHAKLRERLAKEVSARPEVQRGSTPTTQDSIRRLTERLQRQGKEIPEPRSKQRGLDFEGGDTSFNPEEFEMKSLGEKKPKLGKAKG